MGNACTVDTRKPICQRNMDIDTIATTKRSRASSDHNRQNATRFTFMLNDEEMLISPESSSTITPIVKTSNENPLDIWLKKLSISPRSIFINSPKNDNHDKHATFKGDEGDQGELSVSKYNEDNIHKFGFLTIQTPSNEIYDDRNSTTNTDSSKNANLRQNHDDKTMHSQIMIMPNNKPVMSTTGTTSSTLSTLSSPYGQIQSNLYREQTDTVWDVSDIEDLEEEMKMEMQSMQTQSKSCSVLPSTRDSTPTATATGSVSITSSCSQQSHAMVSGLSIGLGAGGILREDVSTDHDDKVSYEDFASLMSKERTHPKSASLLVNHVPTNTMDTLKFEDDRDLLGIPNIGVERRGSNLVQTESCDWDSDELEKEESHIKKQIKHLRSKSKSKSRAKDVNLNECNTMNENVDNL